MPRAPPHDTGAAMDLTRHVTGAPMSEPREPGNPPPRDPGPRIAAWFVAVAVVVIVAAIAWYAL